MIQLVPMSETEYDAFLALSMADHIRGQVLAGYWAADEAEAKMQQQLERFLPNGLTTPDHHFYTIQNPDQGAEVGALWYFATEKDGQRLIFVMDIQVYEDYKRRGFGSQAFQAMEAQALEMGIKLIALNVFEHNTAARTMYQKLGYVGEGENMFKQLGG